MGVTPDVAPVSLKSPPEMEVIPAGPPDMAVMAGLTVGASGGRDANEEDLLLLLPPLRSAKPIDGLETAPWSRSMADSSSRWGGSRSSPSRFKACRAATTCNWTDWSATYMCMALS
jgi:hypothetical protein